jgi:uncharacterized membrane protein
MRSRTRLFLVGAALAALMVPVADDADRWVPWAVAIAYVVMFLLSALEDWDRRRR